MEVHRIRSHVADVVREVGREMFGLDTELRLCLGALYAGGHVLLEGNPGLGKTELAKSLSRVLGLPSGRIQFTPDLMPSDITGTLMPAGDNLRLEFQKGPIFTSVLLADEINRATPKTQSAMLEAMAEKKVTVLGQEHKLPQPFIVLATQNPIDHEGTYNIPAAQADRFMFRIRMPVPGAATLADIVTKRSSNWNGSHAGFAESTGLASPQQLVEAIGRTVRSVEPLPAVSTHISNLYLATNRKFDELEAPAGKVSDIRATVRNFQFGISPRAAGDIMLGAKAWVCLAEDDIDRASAFHLQAVAGHALRHRLRLSFEPDAEDAQAQTLRDDPDALLEYSIRRLCVLTAPKMSGYDRYWQRW